MTHHASHYEIDDQSLWLGDAGRRFALIAGIVGIAGIALTLLLALISGASGGGGWDHFFRTWTASFFFITTICLGGLFFVFVQHATRAGWSVPLRRVAEAFAANLAWLWVLFLPVLAAVFWGHQYHWVHPEGDLLLEGKKAYLNVPFWIVRSALYLTIWAILGLFFFRNSVRQDATGEVALTHRMQWFAPLSAVLFALTITFAAVDWVMSIEAHWFSTIFGVYAFAGACCGFFSAMIITFYLLQRAGKVRREVTLEHYQDMGKLLFAFGVVFWAYIGFSQFMLIWYANIPEETTWFFARTTAGWTTVSWILIICHFAIPFVLLVTKHTKRRPGMLALIAAWMLVMHFIDVYWLAMPKLPGYLHDAESLAGLRAMIEQNMAIGPGAEGFDPALDNGWITHPLMWLMSLSCLVGMLGLLGWATARRLTTCALIPQRDPRLAEGLAFENM